MTWNCCHKTIIELCVNVYIHVLSATTVVHDPWSLRVEWKAFQSLAGTTTPYPWWKLRPKILELCEGCCYDVGCYTRNVWEGACTRPYEARNKNLIDTPQVALNNLNLIKYWPISSFLKLWTAASHSFHTKRTGVVMLPTLYWEPSSSPTWVMARWGRLSGKLPCVTHCPMKPRSFLITASWRVTCWRRVSTSVHRPSLSLSNQTPTTKKKWKNLSKVHAAHVHSNHPDLSTKGPRVTETQTPLNIIKNTLVMPSSHWRQATENIEFMTVLRDTNCSKFKHSESSDHSDQFNLSPLITCQIQPE